MLLRPSRINSGCNSTNSASQCQMGISTAFTVVNYVKKNVIVQISAVLDTSFA